MLLRILSETPVWVFVLLAFLVWQGIRALSDRAMPLWRVLMVPLVFMVIGLARLAFLRADIQTPLVAWIAAAMGFARPTAVRRGRGRRCGSAINLRCGLSASRSRAPAPVTSRDG